MVRLTFISLLTLAVTAYAALDPSELKNVGQGNGKQFITGKCLSDADCSTNCCAGKNGGGVCSAVAVANADGKTGCGFGGGNGVGGGQDNGANAGNNGANAGNNGGNAGNGGNQGVATGDGAQNFGNGAGKQFITGVCASDADCASTCCAKTTKACAAIGAVGAENCGFVA
ncbi:hypothetical protein H634G_01382 [Metarhizium anisopliae BRIP 53293]|uniref:Biotrophy-associated secreted protein 2 n=1 Tax=Metarhizium anisopliae BRIP 53293 TaxID=1291518 RepID=A0A0D9PAU7_METAN|nr:hypothetical protein H634G_01382 [Metarhizium anisopliae BRIP 53293]KJK85611.1 hypothetical protein H633G_10542 [Metarhizium anisopliae BRIP 53284]